MQKINMAMTACPNCGFEERRSAQPVNSLQRRTVLKGRYLVGNVMGQGGFGLTYVGYDAVLDMKVAIKEYFPTNNASRIGSYSSNVTWNPAIRDERRRAMESFLKEARKMARLDGIPAIVRVKDTFEENQTAYIVMEFVEGMTLKQYLLKNGTMDLNLCLKVLGPVLESLALVHDKGFVHRDISPENIMIRPDGTARVLDMGAAVDVQKGGGPSEVVVKKNFSAPEQYVASARLGSWTDVYAMAATIYYCLTGRLVPEVMERRMLGVGIEFDKSPGIPAAAQDAIKAALELEADKRTRDMRSLRQSLEKAAGINAVKEEKKSDVKKKKPDTGAGGGPGRTAGGRWMIVLAAVMFVVGAALILARPKPRKLPEGIMQEERGREESRGSGAGESAGADADPVTEQVTGTADSPGTDDNHVKEQVTGAEESPETEIGAETAESSGSEENGAGTEERAGTKSGSEAAEGSGIKESAGAEKNSETEISAEAAESGEIEESAGTEESPETEGKHSRGK